MCGLRLSLHGCAGGDYRGPPALLQYLGYETRHLTRRGLAEGAQFVFLRPVAAFFRYSVKPSNLCERPDAQVG